jgi:hypothetical protein
MFVQYTVSHNKKSDEAVLSLLLQIVQKAKRWLYAPSIGRKRTENKALAMATALVFKPNA